MFSTVARQLADTILAVTEGISGVLFIAAVTLELVNLAMRWMGGGIPEAPEFTALVMVAIAFLGMARAFRRGEHARFSALEQLLPETMQFVWACVGTLLNIAAMGVLLWLGIKMTMGFYLIGNGGFSMPWMPIWIWALCIPIGAAVSLIALLAVLVGGFPPENSDSIGPE